MTKREFNLQLGANIRRAREAAGIRQNELAAAIGFWPSQMCRVEQGTQKIGVNQLRWLAGALGVSAVSLLPQL